MKISYKKMLAGFRSSKYLFLFRNKYLVASAAFLVWMIFFDKNDIASQIQLRQKLSGFEQKKEYYQLQIDRVNKTKQELLTNQASLEKFARERYMMKKPNEDLYVIVPEKKEEKK